MRADKIERFSVEICKSTLHQQVFGLVYPPVYDEGIADRMTDAYIQYHLAIKPNVPVVLFSLESLVGVGSRVFVNENDTIYHLPPRMYSNLEDVVAEDIFIVSESYLSHVIKSGRLHKSIFASLHEARQSDGLNVLGIYHAPKMS